MNDAARCARAIQAPHHRVLVGVVRAHWKYGTKMGVKSKSGIIEVFNIFFAVSYWTIKLRGRNCT